MPKTLEQLVVELGADNNRLRRELRLAQRDVRGFSLNSQRDLRRLQRSLDRTATGFKTVGRTLTLGVTAPLVAAGAASIRLANEFDTSLSRIEGLVGVNREQVQAWREDLLRLPGATGRGPRELADALFFVTSAGFKGSAAIDVVTQSAKAATAGLGETKVVADAATSAINAYGQENLSASTAVGILTATVREGKASADSIAPSLGRVIPVAAELSVRFNEVGAGIAALTRTGASAEEAATQLVGILNSLLKPSAKAETSLAAIGTSMAEVREEVRERGLLAVLDDLKERLEGRGLGLQDVLENTRALRGALSLLGANAESVRGIFQSLANETGQSLGPAYAAAQNEAQRLRTAQARLEAASIRVGDALKGPVADAATSLADALEHATTVWRDLDDATRHTLLSVAGTAAAVGPATIALGSMISSLRVIIGLIPPIVAFLGPVGALAAGAIAIGASKRAIDELKRSLRSMDEVLDDLRPNFANLVGQLRLVSITPELNRLTRELDDAQRDFEAQQQRVEQNDLRILARGNLDAQRQLDILEERRRRVAELQAEIRTLIRGQITGNLDALRAEQERLLAEGLGFGVRPERTGDEDGDGDGDGGGGGGAAAEAERLAEQRIAFERQLTRDLLTQADERIKLVRLETRERVAELDKLLEARVLSEEEYRREAERLDELEGARISQIENERAQARIQFERQITQGLAQGTEDRVRLIRLETEVQLEQLDLLADRIKLTEEERAKLRKTILDAEKAKIAQVANESGGALKEVFDLLAETSQDVFRQIQRDGELAFGEIATTFLLELAKMEAAALAADLGNLIAGKSAPGGSSSLIVQGISAIASAVGGAIGGGGGAASAVRSPSQQEFQTFQLPEPAVQLPGPSADLSALNTSRQSGDGSLRVNVVNSVPGVQARANQVVAPDGSRQLEIVLEEGFASLLSSGAFRSELGQRHSAGGR